MEEFLSPLIVEGRVTSIQFSTATLDEICKASISDCSISHPRQLSNPFLGLPLDSGRCESCGTPENEKCEGHFGYIQLPVPIYHPRHIRELKNILSLLCLKCRRLKKGKVLHSQTPKCLAALCMCQNVPAMSIKEAKTVDGAVYLELKVSSKAKLRNGYWQFLDMYGFYYHGDTCCRSLLAKEALEILKNIPSETKEHLAMKGFCPQTGYIIECLPVPPNCLTVPNISNGADIMTNDLSLSMLRNVLNRVEAIRKSRSGSPNFVSHEIEANELQSVVAQYIDFRGTAGAPHVRRNFLVDCLNKTSNRVWLEKMRTLFISKNSSFSSRCVITGDAFRGIHEIGLPLEIARKMTFEEKVTVHNISRLSKMMDDKLCLTYNDGVSTYYVREGSKGSTLLRVGHTVNRRIFDGDTVFINRPPTTHKHSLQAMSAYVHEDNTIKIHPLICPPLGADFDGDCLHIYYPQSFAAKAEVRELFSVEQQLISSHTGSLNLHLVHDSLMSLKLLIQKFFLCKAAVQQLAMHVPYTFPNPMLYKSLHTIPQWTVLQLLECVLPADFNCSSKSHLIRHGEIMRLDFNRDSLQSSFYDISTLVLKEKGPKEALNVFNSLEPLLMEFLFSEGYSLSLKDFCVPKAILGDLKKMIHHISSRIFYMRLKCNGDVLVDDYLENIKVPLVSFLRKSALSNLIDSINGSAISKVVEQLGFLGLQLQEKDKFYSYCLVENVNLKFRSIPMVDGRDYFCEAVGLVKASFIEGLNPYEGLVHSISSRESMIRSSRGLTEPGTLFKSLMGILRDVVISYDGTVRNLCSNSVIQFEYGIGPKHNAAAPGEPVGVLAATALSCPAYRAVLDSSESSNLSWKLMKEILLCKFNVKSDNFNDRHVLLFMKDCTCGKDYCKKIAAHKVQDHLKKVTLKEIAISVTIMYQSRRHGDIEIEGGLVGHVHLDKSKLMGVCYGMEQVHKVCAKAIETHETRRNHLSHYFKGIRLASSERCSSHSLSKEDQLEKPCLCFYYDGNSAHNESIVQTAEIMASVICPLLLETVIKGDPKLCQCRIIWTEPGSASWVLKQGIARKHELAVDVVIDKEVMMENGDAWRIIMECCLPIMHLIDINRSVPYGVKEIEKLLGVLCVFEQAVQRLSLSIENVMKGMLKEHLVLVASSMCCTGKLIGFNTRGCKELFHSLNVHMPVTEATLLAPRRCFEKASEKCSIDSLSSIVACCAWGKPVTVGTGAKFDILWDTKEVGCDQDFGLHACDFLQMVRVAAGGRENSGCLGVDVDELFEEHVSSPELQPDLKNLIFDDDIDNNVTFDNVNGTGSICSGGWEGGWNPGKSVDNSEEIWGSKADKSRAISVSDDVSDCWEPTLSCIGNVHKNENTCDFDLSESRRKRRNFNSGVKDDGITQAEYSPSLEASDGWGEKQSICDFRWGLDSSEPAVEKLHPSSTSGGWNSDCPGDAGNMGSWWVDGQRATRSSKDLCNRSSWDASGAHVKRASDQNCSSNDWSSFLPQGVASAKHDVDPCKSWNVNNDSTNASSSQNNCLVKSNAPNDKISNSSSEDDSPYYDVQINENSKQIESLKSAGHSGWEENKLGSMPKSNTIDAWGTWSSSGVASPDNASWKAQDQFFVKSDAWRGSSSLSIDGWKDESFDKKKYRKPSDGGQKFVASVTRESNTRDSSSGGGWRAKKCSTRPSKFDENVGWNANGIFTATGVRMDQFTSEEIEILNDVNPIVKSVKNIFRKSSNGEKLSGDDQAFVLHKVFCYHPGRDAKMSDKFDFVMVDEAEVHKGSRCFYLVSTDGSKQDFSYLKCMWNYVQEKYSERAEAFCKKYFKILDPRE